MGLAGRPVRATADALNPVRGGAGLADRPGDAHAHPIIDFRALGERNFAMSCIIMFSAMVVVYCGSIALPMLLQALMGYDALASGLVMSPSGVSCLAAMVVVGILLGRQVDARWLIAAGLVVMAAAYYWLARLNLQISPTHVVWPWMLMAAGPGGCCSPRSTWPPSSTLLHICAGRRSDCSACCAPRGAASAPRWPGPSRPRHQFHLSRLAENLGPLNPHVQSFMDQGQGLFMQWTGDPVRSKQMSLQVLDNLRQQQALSLAFFDIFWLCAVLAVVLVVLVLLMKRSVAEKGEHVSAH